MSDAARAAGLLWDAWSGGAPLEALPEDCRPADLTEGYAIQARLDELGGARTGWKIAATGPAGRASLKVDHPLAGPMFERFVVAAGGTIERSIVRIDMLEAEFGFVLGRDLPAQEAPFEHGDVLAAITAFVPALELPNTRYVDQTVVGPAQLVADGACAGVFVLGERVADFDAGALPEATVTLTTSGGEAQGTGANVLGDPIEAVRWLANTVAEQGRELRAGEVVITGAAAAETGLQPGPVRADFGALGAVEITLT